MGAFGAGAESDRGSGEERLFSMVNPEILVLFFILSDPLGVI